MTSAAGRARLEGGHKWRLRLIATGAAVLLAAAVFFLQRMPAAVTLTDANDELSATSIQTLALHNLRAAPVMQYDGAEGAGLRVSASTGRLAPSTRANLRALGVSVPNVKGGPIQWQGKPAENERIAVRIKNERQAPDAGMMLQATGHGNIAELNLRAVQTVLTAQIDVSAQAEGDVPTAELKFAGTDIDDPALGFAPLQFEIPPGEWLNLTFDNTQALENSTFRLGELLGTGGTATALSVGRAEVGRLARGQFHPQLQSVLQGVCSAPQGKLLLTSFYPSPGKCTLSEDSELDNLFASDISVEPRKVSLALEGSGFVLSNGRAQPAAFWSSLMANPLIAALMGALVFAIARPVWKLWTGRDM